MKEQMSFDDFLEFVLPSEYVYEDFAEFNVSP